MILLQERTLPDIKTAECSFTAPDHLRGVRCSLTPNLLQTSVNSLRKGPSASFDTSISCLLLCNFSCWTWNSLLSSNSLSTPMSEGAQCLLEWMDLLKRHPYLDDKGAAAHSVLSFFEGWAQLKSILFLKQQIHCHLNTLSLGKLYIFSEVNSLFYQPSLSPNWLSEQILKFLRMLQKLKAFEMETAAADQLQGYFHSKDCSVVNGTWIPSVCSALY